MDPNEELFAEDQNVEITDLPDHEQARPAEHRARPRVDVAARPFWKWRLPQLAALILLALSSLALLLRGMPDPGSSLFTGIFGPAPTPTESTLSNTNLFYVNKGPGWARVTIDGQRLLNPPVVGREPPLRFPSGSHRITWQAAPFPPQSCVVSVPLRATDTCSTEAITAPGGDLARVISFLASPASLTHAEHASLNAAIAAALAHVQASDLVYPGEHFVGESNNNGGLIATARQELRATLTLTLDSNQTGGGHSCTGGDTLGSCTLQGQDCHALCAQENSSSGAWSVVALVQSSWTYTTLDGQPVAAHVADATGRAAFVEHFLPMSVTWDGAHWHAQAGQDFLNGPIPCAAAQDNDAIGDFFGSSPWQTFGWNYVPAANSAAGCLLALTSIVYGGPSPADRPLIVYLHRFGVFVAVNRLAQEYDPEMPHPNAYELNLAQQLAAQAHLTFSL